MSSQHIPAWKRLGLKLKHATETAPATISAVNSNENGRKRKQESTRYSAIGQKGIHNQRKRRRTSDDASEDELKIDPHDVISAVSNAGDLKRKKSVSFTPDTKLEDGDSAQSIQFLVPDSIGSTANKGTEENILERLPSRLGRSKRDKKSKADKVVSQVATPRKATAALDYLNQYYYKRSSWKFNKNHETWILKHALSSEQIPPQKTLALATYVHGLQSAASRQRLVEQSRDAIVGDDALTHISEENNAEFKVLINESFAGLGFAAGADTAIEYPSWLLSLHRGIVILLALDESIQHPTKLEKMKGGQAPRAKKNKSRTSRIEVDSSSSSDTETESESDGDGSGSDDSDQNQSTRLIRSGAPNGSNLEDTSSSGSSTESSATSSDEEDSNDSDTD